MSPPDKARRAFLLQTAAGMGAAAATAVLPAGPAEAQAHMPPDGMAMPSAPSATQSHGEGTCAFFNFADSRTIAAFTERLMPGAPGKPGALDAGVLNYIDLALAGAYADQQEFYRQGLNQLHAYCQATYKMDFAALAPVQQDEVIEALESGKATGFAWPKAQAFFNTLRTHTMEGMFADPVYGGNRNFAGWRLVGFPGAQQFYSPEDMKSTGAFTRLPTIGMQS